MGKAPVQKTEITLSFEPGISKHFPSVREYVQYRIRMSGKDQNLVAAEMDLSPSDLCRKLAENPNDKRRFTSRDLEAYMRTQFDYTPLNYLAEKFLSPKSSDEIRKKIAELKAMLGEDEKSRK
jgi:hypothetical protein